MTRPKHDLGDAEHTRLCPSCQDIITRRDEKRGRCPGCGGLLLSLAFEVAFVKREESK